MSILNVDKIQPIGGGSTITVDATDIQASTSTIRASTFSGDVSATGIGVTSLNITGVTTSTGGFVGALTGTASNASGATGDFSIADKIVHTGDTNTAIRFPGADTFSVETAASERLRILSSGNIGIGTDTAPHKLSVKGTISKISGASGIQLVNISQDGSNHGTIAINQSGGVERIKLHSSGVSYFNGGQVNIGGDLTQTTYPFSVLGSTGGTGQINIVQRLKFSGNNDVYNTGTVIAFTNTSSNANAYSYIGARIDKSAAGDNANALIFATNDTNTAPTEKLRITSAGLVGIGITNPISKIGVQGTGNGSTGSVNLGDTAAAASLFLKTHSGSSVGLSLGGRNTGGQYIQGEYQNSTVVSVRDVCINPYGGGVGIGTFAPNFGGAPGADTIVFGTSQTERLRIDSSGRLLVGHTATVDTSTFNSKIQVMDTDAEASITVGRFGNDGSATAINLSKSRATSIGSHSSGDLHDNDIIGNIFWWGSDGGDYEEVARISAEADAAFTGSSTPGALTFHTTASGATTATERLRIDNSGNVTKPTNFHILVQRSGNQTGYNASNMSDVIIWNSVATGESSTGAASHFNTSTGLFTAPVTGMYHFHVSVNCNYNVEGGWINVNGSRPNYACFYPNNAASADGHLTYHITAGETVGIKWYDNGNTSTTINANTNHTWWRIVLLG